MSAERPGGPIDPFSEYDLYDVLEGSIPAGRSTEYEGLHLTSQTDDGDRVHVCPDGHLGSVATIHGDDYDDVLELVDELNSHLSLWHELQFQDDREALVKWAGKLMTSDEELAESEPEVWIHVPDDPPEANGVTG